MFRTTFGSSLGATQMIAAWIKAPDDTHEQRTSAKRAQLLLVRWLNAAFRLLVLELRGLPVDEIGQRLVSSRLLNDREWAHIEGRSSRATHVYQWASNVVADMARKGYLQHPWVTNLNDQLNLLRGANVWRLPSLPYPYTMMITFMVKFKLFFMANVRAFYLRRAWPADHNDPRGALAVLAILFDICVSVFMYQGLLDLHGWLYSPNAGITIGHLPADNFLDYVQTVTMDIINESGTSAEQLPYTLDMAPCIPLQTEQHRQTRKTEPSLDGSKETPKHTAV
jgi:hypothetical protein|mmetsp:Transcript_40603/g.92092  ORF Transcript_40603/g.92092 Transcript_40603/m.92092 type:complete len:281 (-) Transcript_40603:337-1179(-)|eukprot:CAMPEP_0181208058 /NCGR_PEP_ID=MMETSP1096-20121128/21920_1 /TAXON_ID=156174 ORGANISM="Chrysochromulina ericina, Strain CCMP281" /NCGR_SAMPLE_ID=MMETSP1096 /ASSEMBLY_ACC=CAM_ASM_000453 /LENGTH=280 /DNA_ID=CAMNT_0023299107 /DNA_START=503 /DNA_END=1345 /DNA_ORIENTATION=-